MSNILIKMKSGIWAMKHAEEIKINLKNFKLIKYALENNLFYTCIMYTNSICMHKYLHTGI